MVNFHFRRLGLSAVRSAGAALLLAACTDPAGWATAQAASGSDGSAAAAPETGLAHSTKFKRKAPPTAARDKTPYGQDADDYILTFSEEFDRFDRRLWNDHIWYEASSPTQNYAVEDGVLKIWPQRDTDGRFFNRTIDTDGRYEQAYGYFEMEAKLPKGKGTWPAFWLFAHPGKRRPEIDIMEAYPGGVSPWGQKDHRGVPYPRAYGITVWYDQGVEAGRRQHDAKTDLSAKFHKYALKWEPHKQTFYFDGKQVLTVQAAMSDPMYLMLDLWFGSASGTPDDSTPQGKSNSYEINYVRAWQFRTAPSR